MKNFINPIKILPLLFAVLVSPISASVFPDDSTKGVIDSSQITLLNAYNADSDQFSDEKFFATANEKLNKPFKVRVLFKGNEPLKDYPVVFKVLSAPKKSTNTFLEKDTVLTDQNGYAENYATLGSEEGDYEFAARISTNSDINDIVYFRAYARSSNWVFSLTVGLIGGLALFLFGLDMMSEGMKNTAGGRLRSILSTLTNNRFIAVALGTFVTMVVQSSSATTVMLVSFVHANLMTFGQTLGVLVGAGIGTTITAQIIAFKLTDYSLLILGLGFFIYYFPKSKNYKNVGETILGFGLLFFGMWIMSNGMKPLRTYDQFINIIMKLENPVVGILAGAFFTALIQSSSAFTGILITLGTQGLITLEAAIPLIFGANIGTSITAVLASMNTSRESKRVALAHTLFKILGVLLFVWWIPSFAGMVKSISPQGSPGVGGIDYLAEVVPRQIANAHTIFNVGLTLIVLPFINMFAKFIERLLPDKPEEEEESLFSTKYIEESLISTPTLALNLAKAEIIRMAEKSKKMVEKIIIPFINGKAETIDELKNMEEEIDFLNDRISTYLMKISQRSENEERADEIFDMMHCVKEIEKIGDVVSKRLIPLANKRLELNQNFSEEGKKEIEDYHLRTVKQIARAIEVFKDVNLQNAKRMEKKYKKYRLMERDLRRTHFERLKDNVLTSIETSEIHLELVDLLKRISSNATNIARIFLEKKKYPK